MSENRVDYRKVFAEIRKHKMAYVKVVPVVMVLAAFYILCVPRTYTTETEVALESDTGGNGAGALGSLASTFGLDLSSMESSDAITPLLYPDLMKDNGFVASLFNIQIQTQDGKLKTDYYTYLKKYQDAPWWTAMMTKIKLLFTPKGKGNGNEKLDPYHLSRLDDGIMENIRSSITIKVDKKTGAISISTTAQDPMACKIIADSVREHLQTFITDYRTNKARKDMEYYKSLRDKAKASYEKQRQAYGKYSDANEELILQSYKSKQEDMENEMQLRYNTYSTMNTQYQAAVAKVQEKTPAFTLIQGAAVPAKPAGPKRVLFVLAMTILGILGTTAWILREIILPKSEDDAEMAEQQPAIENALVE